MRNAPQTFRSGVSGLQAAFVALITSATLTIAASAQTSLLSSSSPSAFSFSGGTAATGSIVSVSGQPFTQAWHVTVSSKPANVYDVMLSAGITSSVAKGEALIATFYYRRTDTLADESNFFAYFERSGTPFEKSLSLPLRGRGQWRRVSLPFIAADNYAAGGAKLDFQLGAQTQEIEIGGVELKKYGQRSVFGTGLTDASSQFTFLGSGYATNTSVAASGQPFFTTASRIQVTSAPGVDYNVRLLAKAPAAVNAGDTLVAIFWMRDADSDGALAVGGAAAEQASDPYTKSFNIGTLTLDGSWKQHVIPFTAAGTYAANGMQFFVKCGAKIQTVDVGGLQLLNFGALAAASSLNSTEHDYPGQTLNSSWRTDAETRIEQIRKADFTLNVKNASNLAISGVNVSAAMQKHLFGFGSALAASRLTTATGTDADRYRSETKSLFNKAVLENDLKWKNWESNPQLARDGIAWLRNNGILNIRGHNLVWPSWQYSPSDVQTLTGSALSSRVLNHIDNEAGDAGVKKFLTDWDVVNEPYTNDDIMNTLNGISGAGDGTAAQDAQVIKDWYARAKTNDPFPYRFLNDFGVETNATHLTQAKEDYEISLLTALDSAGAPIDGYGFQSHFGSNCTPPVTAKAIFDRFAALGLTLQITEYDHNTSDEGLQGDYLADYLTLAFSHASFDAFLVWEFWDSAHWLSNAPIYRADWSLKPSGEAWKGLVYGKWWTSTSGTTNASGTASARGFLGRYALTAGSGGITKTYYADLAPGGSTVNLKLAGTTGSKKVWLHEAESAFVYSPLAVGSDAGALGGKYAAAPDGTDNYSTPTRDDMRIDTDALGTVTVWLRVIAPDDTSDSVWIRADGGAWENLGLTQGTAWHWVKWKQVTFASGAAHSISFANREGGAKIDQVLITDDAAFTP